MFLTYSLIRTLVEGARGLPHWAQAVLVLGVVAIGCMWIIRAMGLSGRIMGGVAIGSAYIVRTSRNLISRSLRTKPQGSPQDTTFPLDHK